MVTFDKRRKDVQLLEHFAENLILAKVHEKECNASYWTLIDVNGQIQEMPPKMRELLCDQRFKWRTLDVRQAESGMFGDRDKLVLVFSTFDTMRAVSKTK